MPTINTVYYGTSSKKADTKIDSAGKNTLPPVVQNAPDGEGMFKKITQEMYKQNLELSVRNKTLGVLKTLYAITMSTLELKEVAQRIVDTITKELNFTAALIALVDQEAKVLRPVAITQSPQIIESIETIGKPFSEITISLTETANLAIDVINERQRKVTGNLLDILIPHVSQEEADIIENKTKIKTLIIYPIQLGERVVGVLEIGIAKKVDDLSRSERETLDQLIDMVGIALDRAQLHENLRLANEKLQELDKLKDEFVSLASHELRTPMTAIKGSLSTILEGYAGNVSDQSREFLTSAYNENDRLIRLVNNLLNISRIEAGRFTFNVTKVDLNKLITEVVENLQMAATEKGLFLKFGQVTGLPLVYADSDKVKEVVINLVGNAIKFTHKGGITVKCDVKDGFVQTAVTDTGSGISKEDQELLFKKFSQARGGYSKQAGGTGLGLYISKQIIEGQKGKILLESVLGQGSTFYFTLPIVG